MRYVIAGNSAAAIHAIEAIRAHDPVGEIVLVAPDLQSYSRVFLPELVSGEKTLEDVAMRPPGFYAGHRVHCLEEKAVGLDPARRRLSLAGGARLEYDRLLVATGAVPALPSLPGVELDGVLVARDFSDVALLKERASPGLPVVVIGASFAGLKLAAALQHRGCRVAIAGRVLRRALDDTGGRLVEAAITQSGADLWPGVRARALLGTSRVEAVELVDGTRLEAGLVLLASGVTPNTRWLESSGIALAADGSVVTGSYMQTSIPGVYAAGDVAQGLDIVTGVKRPLLLWPVAVEQGRVAGASMAGGYARYEGSVPRNTGTFFGVTVATAGATGGLPGAVTRVRGPGPGGYVKRWYQGPRLVGFLAVGCSGPTGHWITAMTRAQHPWLQSGSGSIGSVLSHRLGISNSEGGIANG
ncbi:MAG: FAD-dependent oxidoreductase [Bacillota bacterium]